jgi:hypothetical protein
MGFRQENTTMFKALIGGTAALAVLYTSAPAHAADITIEDGGILGQMVNIIHEIVPGDYDRFVAATKNLTGTHMVWLNSPGGNLMEGLKIGQTIHDRGWVTFVGAECDSACSAIWLSGKTRLMTEDAKIGFHAVSLAGKESSSGGAVLGAYMYSLGLGYPAIAWATTAAPDDIQYLTEAKAKELGIDVDVIRNPATPAKVMPAPAPPAPVKTYRDCSKVDMDSRSAKARPETTTS